MIVHGVVAVHREDSAKRVSVNGVNSNAAGGFWAANCGFCRKCFAKCDNVFEENNVSLNQQSQISKMIDQYEISNF